MRDACACGALATHIDERGEACCEACPRRQGLDAIALADVPRLLGWARITIEYLRGRNAHIPAGDGIRAMLGDRPARICGADCARTCACHREGWGGHSEALCSHL